MTHNVSITWELVKVSVTGFHHRCVDSHSGGRAHPAGLPGPPGDPDASDAGGPPFNSIYNLQDMGWSERPVQSLANRPTDGRRPRHHWPHVTSDIKEDGIQLQIYTSFHAFSNAPCLTLVSNIPSWPPNAECNGRF